MRSHMLNYRCTETISKSIVRKFASLDSDGSGELSYRETLGIWDKV